MKQSLAGHRSKRQVFMMENSRKAYRNTIKILKMWRLKREEHTYWKIFHVFDVGNGVADQNDYEVMREVLTTDIFLCNGQRPGVVTTLVVSDFEDAEQGIITEGCNRLMVTEHRTGYL